MKFVINRQIVLSRAPEGPLAGRISSFAEWLSGQGYALHSIHRQVLLAACFSRWLKQKGVGVRSLALRAVTGRHSKQHHAAFRPDATEKRAAADREVLELADRWLDKPYRALEQLRLERAATQAA